MRLMLKEWHSQLRYTTSGNPFEHVGVLPALMYNFESIGHVEATLQRFTVDDQIPIYVLIDIFVGIAS